MSKAATAKKARTEKPKTVKIPKNFERMKSNPKNDWKISDIKQVANAIGMSVQNPNGGSHYSVFSPYLRGALTVPHRKPIKPFYIKSFVKMCEAHIVASKEESA